MVYLEFHEEWLCLFTMSVEIQGILNSFLWCPLYLHSCSPSIQSLSLLSFPCQYCCCVTALVPWAPVLLAGRIVFLSWQPNQCLLAQLWMTSVVICIVRCHLCLTANILYYKFLDLLDACCHVWWLECLVVMHVGMSVVMLMELMLMFIPVFLHPLFSAWFCPYSQSYMYISGPFLYIMCIWYWWILGRTNCNPVDRFNTSFLNILTRGLWAVIISHAKQ